MILKLLHVKHFWSDSKTFALENDGHIRPPQGQPRHAPEWARLQASSLSAAVVSPLMIPAAETQRRQSNRGKVMHA
jgi:hypothetical protein